MNAVDFRLDFMPIVDILLLRFPGSLRNNAVFQ
jgi:hypothetical protein